MKSTAIFTTILAVLGLSGAAHAADGSDYTFRSPLNSNASLSGAMFTNTTEILTPRGIVDEPDTRFTLQQEPAAGPDDDSADTETAAMPEISPPTANSTLLSPTTISPAPVSASALLSPTTR